MSSNRSLTLSPNYKAEGDCILYVMSRDQRIQDNHALLAAQQDAIEKSLPLLVVFNLLEKTGYRTREHFSFMLHGLEQVSSGLEKINIRFVLMYGDAANNISKISKETNPAHIYFDFNPLKGVRKTQKTIASKLKAGCTVVDTHNIIPLWVLSDKEEFAAHTIRSKVHKNLEQWLNEPGKVKEHPHEYTGKLSEIDFTEARIRIEKIKPSGSIISYKSGEKAALKHLSDFIEKGLVDYAKNRNIPTTDAQSNISPYLHFGQISALRVALELVNIAPEPPLLFIKGKLASYEGEPTLIDSINALLEELIVRKELADNYCFYNKNYSSLQGAKPWAIESLVAHQKDPREYLYTYDQWDQAGTHDEAWNAAQMEMKRTGKMHGYMRMYWAKKILEWSESPEDAIQIAVQLNDTYSIDGGDPNGYTGIMWSIAGVHDRAWFERDVFGKIRYMNRGGLERKFDVEEYIQRWTT